MATILALYTGEAVVQVAAVEIPVNHLLQVRQPQYSPQRSGNNPNLADGGADKRRRAKAKSCDPCGCKRPFAGRLLLKGGISKI